MENYALNKGISTGKLFVNLAEDFIKDKTLTLDYLEEYQLTLVNIPIIDYLKEYHVIPDGLPLSHFESKGNILNYFSNNYLGDLGLESFVEFKINRIPNNLDVWAGETFQSPDNNLLHSGLEFVIILEVILNTKKIDDDKILTTCLYCFLFEVTKNKEINSYLLDYMTAINKLNVKISLNLKLKKKKHVYV